MRGLLSLAVIALPIGCHFPRNESDAKRSDRPWTTPQPTTQPMMKQAVAKVPPPETGIKQAGAQVPAAMPHPGTTAAPIVTAGPVLPPANQPLSLKDLEQLAAANNPTIASAETLIRQQEGLRRQELLYPNPTVGYLRTDADQPNQVGSSGFFLSQDIVTAGKLRLAANEHTQEITVRRWQLDAQRGRVMNDVRIRYYEVLGAQETIRIAERLEKLSDEFVKVAQGLVKAKQAGRPDVLQAEIQLNAIRTAVQDARYRHQAAWTQLANVVGVPNLPITPLADDLEKNIPQLELQASLDHLLTSSPVLNAQQAEIQAAGAILRLSRAQAIPNVNVQVVVQRDHVQKYTSVSPLISMPLPLFNRNQGNIMNAASVLEQQQKEFERIKLALRDQLAATFQQYLSAQSQAQRLKNDILPRVVENLDLTTKAYKAGQYDITRVLSARQEYFETHTAYIDALTALHKVAIEIEGLELTGGLNPTEIGTALQTQLGPGGSGSRRVLLQQLQQQNSGGSRRLPGAVQGGGR